MVADSSVARGKSRHFEDSVSQSLLLLQQASNSPRVAYVNLAPLGSLND
jgi:hypothetical protein